MIHRALTPLLGLAALASAAAGFYGGPPCAAGESELLITPDSAPVPLYVCAPQCSGDGPWPCLAGSENLCPCAAAPYVRCADNGGQDPCVAEDCAMANFSASPPKLYCGATCHFQDDACNAAPGGVCSTYISPPVCAYPKPAEQELQDKAGRKNATRVMSANQTASPASTGFYGAPPCNAGETEVIVTPVGAPVTLYACAPQCSGDGPWSCFAGSENTCPCASTPPYTRCSQNGGVDPCIAESCAMADWGVSPPKLYCGATCHYQDDACTAGAGGKCVTISGSPEYINVCGYPKTAEQELQGAQDKLGGGKKPIRVVAANQQQQPAGRDT